METKEERRARREARNAELKANYKAKMAELEEKNEAKRAALRAKLDAGKTDRKLVKEAKAGRLQEIRDQMGSLDGIAHLLGRREINDLPNILSDDEHIRSALQGRYEGGQGLLVATDRRLVFVDKKLIGNRVKVEDFPYDSISSIKYELEMLMATVTIFASGNEADIEQIIPKDLARSFCETVRSLISKGKDGVSVQHESMSSSIEQMANALERLADLRDRGLLSDKEFAEQKQSLLSKTSL